MAPILHIGPPKTGSTTLQEIIPTLGLPFVIKPAWTKPLCRERAPQVQPMHLPERCIISCEWLGAFDAFSPGTISQRLYKLFGRSVVIYCHRNVDDRMDSWDRFMPRMNPGQGWDSERFRALHRRLFEKRGAGYYATADADAVKAAFHQHDFRLLQFEQLETDPQRFLKSFCDACGVPVPDIELPHANNTRDA